jgi:hypothetical protein
MQAHSVRRCPITAAIRPHGRLPDLRHLHASKTRRNTRCAAFLSQPLSALACSRQEALPARRRPCRLAILRLPALPWFSLSTTMTTGRGSSNGMTGAGLCRVRITTRTMIGTAVTSTSAGSAFSALVRRAFPQETALAPSISTPINGRWPVLNVRAAGLTHATNPPGVALRGLFEKGLVRFDYLSRISICSLHGRPPHVHFPRQSFSGTATTTPSGGGSQLVQPHCRLLSALSELHAPQKARGADSGLNWAH